MSATCGMSSFKKGLIGCIPRLSFITLFDECLKGSRVKQGAQQQTGPPSIGSFQRV